MSLDTNASLMRQQLLRECYAMAHHALASGLKVPGPLIQALVMIGEVQEGEAACLLSEDDQGENGSVAGSLAADSLAVMPIGDSVLQLVQIQGKLTDLIAPATPRTILLLSDERAKGSFWQFLGPVPLIRRMMFMAVFSLVSLLLISLTTQVNGDAQNFSLFTNHGLPLLLNELFLLSAAGIGASFAALFQASQYVQDGTFDPLCESTYWVRFVLGLLAGTILAALIPLETFGKGASASAAAIPSLAKPLLSLLGGFSAVLVYRILQRLLDAVDLLMQGNSKDLAIAQQQAANARAAESAAELRMYMLGNIAALRQEVSSSADPQQLNQDQDQPEKELTSPPGVANRKIVFPAEASAVVGVLSPGGNGTRQTPPRSE